MEKETYQYLICVNDVKYATAYNHSQLIEYLEQIRVERGEGASYKITLYKN